MQGSISKKVITGGFWLALLIFIGVSAVGYWNIRELIENSQKMEHTYKVQAGLEVVLSTFKDAQIGQQSYIITADTALLALYNEAIEIQNTILISFFGFGISLALLVVVYWFRDRENAKRQRAEELLQKHPQVEIALSALRKSEQQYRTLVETIPYGIEEIDTTGMITFSNVAHHQMLGYVPGELLGKPVWDLAPEPERRNLSRYLAGLVQDQPPPTPYLGKNLTKDGNLIDIQVDWNYKRDDQGRVTGFISVVTNITKRKQAELALQRLNQELELRVQQRTAELQQANQQLQAEVRERRQTEEALRASEALFKAIVQNSYDIITLTDEHDNISYQSPSAYRIMGYPSAGLPKKQPVRKVHVEDIPKVQSAIAAILAQPGVPVTVEYRMQRADGSWAWLESVGTNWLADPNIRAIVANTRDMSDRKQAEDALRQSEERLRQIFINSPIGIALATPDGKLFQINPAFCQMLGYSESELTALTFGEITHPQDLAKELPYAERLLRGEIADYPMEKRYIKKDGSLVWGQLSVGVVHDHEGNICGLGMIEDITERKRSDEKLRESEANLAEAQRIAHVGGWAFDVATQKITWSAEAFRIFGFNPDQPEPTYSELLEYSHPDDKTSWDDQIRQTINQGIPYESDHRILRPDASVRHIHGIGQAIFNENGQVIRLVGTVQDITERKQVEEALRQARDELELRVQERTAELTRINASLQVEISDRKQAEVALRESQHFIQQIADTTPNLIYIYDLSRDCNVYANRQLETFFGRTQPDIQARGSQFLSELLHPDDFQYVSQFQERFVTAKEGEVLENEFRMKNANGEWRWFHNWEVVFTRNSEGLPEQILGTAVDITELKQAEDIRLALQKEKELSHLQRRFFSMVSHEFRTPISTILISAQCLENSYDRWSQQKIIKNLHRIQGGARHTIQLLEDILTINRAETGKLDFHPKHLDLDKFCRNLVEETQLIDNNEHTITWVSQGQCQDAHMDGKLLRSIFNNLLSNAIKYSPKGSKIDFSLVCQQGEAIFKICDQGIGIPTEDLPYLFEPFHRGKNVWNIPGTGLGITVVKKCLDLQGGKISLDSEVGVGTTVTVTIPQGHTNRIS